MKLVSFSVTNFRSITTAHKIPIADTTVLVGKNNEGKSNLLKALSIAMNIIIIHAIEGKSPRSRTGVPVRHRYRRYGEDAYSWERDFPISLQEKKPDHETVFRLEFELDDKEVDQFYNEIKSTLNGSLPIEIRIGSDNNPAVKVSKRGKGSKPLNAKSDKITSFIAKRITFNYIPAIRTHKEAIAVIEDMLTRELRMLEENPDYKKVLQEIEKFQQPILSDLAKRIKAPLSEFLPSIKNVKIVMGDNNRKMIHRSDFEVIVDDGTPTNIEHKGDGVKSLAALGLLKSKSSQEGASIIAIEEPESHLHPGAIHQLNDIISSLEDENQLVITTHNPLFVNRQNIKSNIIIEGGEASQAKNIDKIRELLGIKASDNLVNARYALVVEGEADSVSLKALLPTLSDKLEKALKHNLLILEPVGGAGKLSYKLSLMENALCVYHILLDNDEGGRKAFEKAEKDNYAEVKNTTFVTCKGMKDSEFEDCLDVSVYSKNVMDVFGVNLICNEFSKGKGKWSDRVSSTFLAQGKIWNDEIKKKVKEVVADSVKKNPSKSLNSHKRNAIDSLVIALEGMIKT